MAISVVAIWSIAPQIAIPGETDPEPEPIVIDPTPTAIPEETDPITYAVIINTEGNGKITGWGIYAENTSAQLIAEPDDGWKFVGWYDGDVAVSTDLHYSFKVTQNTTLTASFVRYFNVEVTTQGNGNVEGGGRYVIDTNAVIEAIPSTGNEFKKWIVNGKDSGNINPLILTDSSSVIAVFEPHECIVTTDVIGYGNVIQNTTSYYGDSVVLVPNAMGDYVFWKWVLSNGTENYNEVFIIPKIKEDVSLTAMFHPQTVNITSYSNNPTAGSCTPSGVAIWGNKVVLEATPTEIGIFGGWYVFGELVTTDPILIIDDVTTDLVCEAKFEIDIYDITITKNCQGGTVFVDGVEISHLQKEHGSTITLNVVTDPGYTFDGWYLNSAKVSSSNTIDVSVTRTMEIRASWSYPQNSTIDPGTITSAPFNLRPVLTSDVGVSAVSWKLTNENGSTRTASGFSPSLYVSTWGKYTLSASITYQNGSVRNLSTTFDVTKLTKTYNWRFQASPNNASHVNETYGTFSYTFDKDWYEGYLAKEGTSKLEDNNIYLMPEHVTFNDSVIKDFAQKLENYVGSRGCSDYYAKASAILKFVQSFSYAYDDDQFGVEEYYMYPATFLISGRGDCEDHAFLYASLMKALGHKVILLSGQGHCAVGLDISSGTGTYYRYVSLVKYYYCETTATSAAGYTNYGYQDYGEIGDMGSNYNIYGFIPVPVM